MNMEEGRKFYIVLFKNNNLPDYINQVQCVPHLWVTTSDEPGYVSVSYPSCDLGIDLVLKKGDEFPSVQWSFYQAKILYSTSNTKDASEKLTLYRSTNDALQNKNPSLKMSTEVEAKKRKHDDFFSSSSKSQPTHSTSSVLDMIDLEIESYNAQTLTEFQEVNEERNNSTGTLTDDEGIQQNEGNIDAGVNIPAMFKDLRSRIMLTLHEVQTQIDPNYKSTECEVEHVEINQNEPETNVFPLRGIRKNIKHLNFAASGLNIVELIPDSGIYVQKLRLDYIEKLKEPRLIISILLKAIFREDSLQTLGIGHLNQNALIVLYYFMLHKYSLTLEETREEVITFLKTNKRHSKSVIVI